jgi:predicted DNA-binding transcriptional regulator AlpA
MTFVRRRLSDNYKPRNSKPHPSEPHPLRIFRVGRLARLLDIDPSTLWRWVRDGEWPPPIEIGRGVKGWPEAQIKDLIEKRCRQAERASS